MNEEQVNALKYHNIQLDRIIVLADKDEEDPGKTLKQQKGFEQHALLDMEMNAVNTVSGVLREQFGDENIKEVAIGGSELEVFNRIRTQLDPFYIRFDDEGLVRVPADLGEEDEPIT